MNGRGPEAGFTLVEMLVVLAIVGVTVGATVIGIGAATRSPSAEAEARGLVARIQLAADDAMVTDRPLALRWDAGGYAVVAWDGQDWRAGDGGAFARHALPAGMRLSIAAPSPTVVGIDGTGVPLTGRIANATDAWTIGYDGLKAVAVRVPPA